MRKKIFFSIILIFSIILSACTMKKDNDKEIVEDNFIPVEVENVTKGNIYDDLTFVGRFASSEEGVVIPSIPGKVASIEVKPGDEVNKGQLLFTIENKDVENQVETTKKALDDLKIKRESLINIPSTAMDPSIDVDGFPEGMAKGVREESNILDEIDGKIGELEIAYKQAKDASDKLKVTSTVDGVVTYVNIKEGGMATNQDFSMLISNLDNMYLEINITDNFLNKLERGKEVYIDIPSTGEKNVLGKIDSISLSPNVRTGLYSVKITTDEKISVANGSLGKAYIKFDEKSDVVAIPTDAVVDIDGERFVYTVVDNLAVKNPITTGLDTGNIVEVVKGLNVGEKLIVKGQNYVQDKSKVKVIGGDIK